MATARRYRKSHEWVEFREGFAVVGISDHAQDALGDITFVELPKTGTAVTQGKECGVIESVKAASDIFAPVSGTVTAVNLATVSTPEIVNKEPYDGGWLYKISGVQSSQIDALMDEAAYGIFLKSEK